MAKKKSTHQDKSTESQTNQESRNPTTDTSAASIEDPLEKVSSLKALNSMLLKETVEKRQEVSTLLKSKKSLESELTRSESQIEALRAELTQIRAAGEAGLTSKEKEITTILDSKKSLESELTRSDSEIKALRAELTQIREAGEVGLSSKEKEVATMLESKKSVEFELTRSESQVEALKAELTQFQAENDELRREKEGVEKERNEMEKAKFEGDLAIGSMKKLEKELRSEIKRGREALNRSICENEGLKRDLDAQIKERNKLKKNLAEIEAKERMLHEELRKSESKYQSVGNALEEKEIQIETMQTKLKREIEGLNEEKELILREKSVLNREKCEKDVRIDEMNAIVLSLRKDEEKWRLKFFDSEKTNTEIFEKLNDLMEETKQKEGEIQKLKAENCSALRNSSVLGDELETVKKAMEEILKVKSEQENVIVELRNDINELHGNLSLLKELNRDELEKNRQLFSEIEKYKTDLDRVRVERDEAKKTSAEEKANGMKLQVKVSEISKKMEDTSKVIEELRTTGNTLVGERKELEKKYGKLMEEKSFAEKKLSAAQKKVSDLEASLRSKNDKFEEAVQMLKKTALQLCMENEKKGLGIGTKKKKKNREVTEEPYFEEELDAIRSVFKRREEKEGEMEKEVETLKLCVEEARRKKSFWALVSSATTIFAAVVSFAYASSSTSTPN